MGEAAILSELSTARQNEWIDRLFRRFGAMYGKHFADMWAGQSLAEVKEVWEEELADMTTTEIARGVDACRTRAWPPTLPEFIKLCRPTLDYERAFVEAAKQLPRRERGNDEWSDPAVFWAAMSMSWDVQNNGYQAVRGQWQNALDNAAKKVRSGELPREIPERREALPPTEKTSVPPEKAKKMMADLRKELGFKMRMTRGSKS